MKENFSPDLDMVVPCTLLQDLEFSTIAVGLASEKILIIYNPNPTPITLE